MTDAMHEWPTGRLLGTAARVIEHAWLSALEELGVSHAGLVALHLLGGEGLSQTELAELARVQTQTMSRTLDRLERQGFVVRSRDENDRRRHVIVRTEAGSEIWNRARTIESDVFPGLTDQPQLRELLLEIIRTGGEQ